MLTVLYHILLPLCLMISSPTSGESVTPRGARSGPAAKDLSIMLADRLIRYQGSREKVYLNLPDSKLSRADTLYFSADVVDVEYNAPTERSLTLYAYLFDADGHAVAGDAFYLKGGQASGYLTLGNDLKDGCYYLSAFTARQQGMSPDQVTTRRIEIGVTTTAPPQIDFEVEGGHIIAGLPVSIEVYCPDPGRLKAGMPGVVYDEKGRKAAEVLLNEKGTGEFILRPYQSNFSLSFTGNRGELYAYSLPLTRSRGAALSLLEVRGDTVARLAVRFSHPAPPDNTFLVAAQNNRLLIHQDVPRSRQSLFDIPLQELSDAPLRVALLDDTGSPLSAVDINLSGDIDEVIGFKPDPDSGLLTLTTPEGNALKGRFSLTASAKEALMPYESLYVEEGMGNPVAFWKDLVSADNSSLTGIEDFETCDLLVTDKKGRPQSDKQIVLGDGNHQSSLRTSGEGLIRLPAYRLQEPLVLSLPDQKYVLNAKEDSRRLLFMNRLGQFLSHVEHDECLHPSHTSLHFGTLTLVHKSKAQWTASKFQRTKPHTACQRYLLGSDIMWQAAACTDTAGSLHLNLPAQWKEKPVLLRITGFTEDGWFIDRLLRIE
ncbi:hypothetical protein AB9P05_17435 [Roseivirga sp. BDSF3-8]|uniref:hypothetical protein n=1 Tax=Roseivirga sp. BDSF3-8 TaxID=3241598 RepID=UPI0035326B99